MDEHRKRPVLTQAEFRQRLVKHFFLACLLVAGALGLGILGYHWLAKLDWVDALLNASMILGGMGPVDSLQTSSAKVFASAYALFSGLVFIGVATLITGPFMHRLLHRFHVMDD